jgi:hypothetical protein
MLHRGRNMAKEPRPHGWCGVGERPPECPAFGPNLAYLGVMVREG